MNTDNKKIQRPGAFDAGTGCITPCAGGIFLLNIFQNLGFASGFFEGKPRNKIINKDSSQCK